MSFKNLTMKKILPLLMLLLFCSCGDTMRTRREVKLRVENIYADVFGWYTRAAGATDAMGTMPDFDRLYLSSDYKAWLVQVKAADEKLMDQGYVGFFDYDHWVCGQDFQDLQMKIVSLSPQETSRQEMPRFRAKLEICNCGQRMPLELMLVREQGQWFIDDFISDGSSEKARMQQYLLAQP